jgi:hypothetical protein
MDQPNYEALLGALGEIEKLLQFPGVAGNIDRANILALSIAGVTAPSRISDLATNLIAQANALRADAGVRTGVNHALWHLRVALQEAKRGTAG